VVVTGDTLEFKLAAGQTLRTLTPTNFAAGSSGFLPSLASKNVRIDVRSVSDPEFISYGPVFLALVLVGVLGFTVYRVSSGRILALERKTQEAGHEETTVTFADVAG